MIESISRTSLTYGQFLNEVRQAATFLMSLGIGKGDRIAILLTNSMEIPVIYFACMLLESVAVPINQNLHPKEIQNILRSSKSKIILFSRCTRSLLLAAGNIDSCKQVRIGLRKESNLHRHEKEDQNVFNWLKVKANPDLPDFQELDQNSPFIILYTSGTTGSPKGIVHSIFNELLSAENFNKCMGFDTTDRFLNNWSLAYSSGILNALLCPFMAKASTVICEPFDAKTAMTFWEIVTTHKANTLWLSPTMIASLNRLDKNPDGQKIASSEIKTVCCGTAPLPTSVKEHFEAKYKTVIYESYGLSETLFISTQTKNSPSRPNSVGEILDDIEIFIDGSSTDNSTKNGEIIISAKTTMIGYISDSIDEALSNAKNSFSSGDLGYIDEEGYLYITGRKKDIIIRNGYNISPLAIIEAIRFHPKVEDAIVVGIPHELFGEEVAVAVQMKKGATLAREKSTLLDLCRKRINHASIPTRWVETQEFPRNPNGKIITQSVKDLFFN